MHQGLFELLMPHLWVLFLLLWRDQFFVDAVTVAAILVFRRSILGMGLRERGLVQKNTDNQRLLLLSEGCVFGHLLRPSGEFVVTLFDQK